jgi:hypothetical protein
VHIFRYFCSADTVHLTVNAGDTLLLSPDCVFENDTLKRSTYWYSTAGQFINPDAYETRFFSQTDADVWFQIADYWNLDCVAQQNFSVKVLTVDTGEPRSPSPEIRVSPNPGEDFLKIELSDTQPVTWRLCSSEGRILRQVSGEAQTFRLDVSELPSGVYFLSSNTGWVTKWVK